MKGVDGAGLEVADGRAGGREAGGLLADLGVPTLRAFLIRVMKEGGVPTMKMAKVLRCSRATLFRDLSEAGGGAPADRGEG